MQFMPTSSDAGHSFNVNVPDNQYVNTSLQSARKSYYSSKIEEREILRSTAVCTPVYPRTYTHIRMDSLRAGRPGVRNELEARDFPFSIYAQTGSGPHPVSCTTRTGALSQKLRGQITQLTRNPFQPPVSACNGMLWRDLFSQSWGFHDAGCASQLFLELLRSSWLPLPHHHPPQRPFFGVYFTY